jgi:hypothetical protein
MRAFCLLSGGIVGAFVVACSPPPAHRQVEMVPIGTYTPPEGQGTTAPTTDTDTTPDNSAPLQSTDKASECSGAKFDNLYLTLTNSACVVDTRGDKPVDVKEQLDLSVAAKTPEIVPGGRVDLVITYKNKSTRPLQLNFTLDPSPRFDVEALDSKGRVVGVPKGKPPKAAKPSQKTTARITISPGGVAKMKVGWNASNTRWATEQVKGGEVPEGGYPKAPTTPLPTGSYTLRVLTPLTLVEESRDRELTAPKVSMDVKE